jgi:two-component system, OmpR family, response regulator CpxR
MHPLRILVVEDDPDIREMLIACLSQEGEVEGAADGQEALERLARGPPPSVLLLDLRMPRLSGEELLREMERSPSQPPVVTMSACTHEAPPGSWAHLDKPFAIEDAVAVLRRVCREAEEAWADQGLPCDGRATRPRPPASCASAAPPPPPR